VLTVFKCKLNKVYILDPPIQNSILIRAYYREAFEERDPKALYCGGFVQVTAV
jgi:hypothetical protein